MSHLILLVLAVSVAAVELTNWRAPYFRIASEMGLVTSSPSGFFWDDCGPAPLFDSTLWLPRATAERSHWLLEPFVAGGTIVPREQGDRAGYGVGGILNDLRYHNLVVRQTLRVDTRYEDDSLYPAHPDRFARGRIEEAYARLDWRYGSMRFGRMLRAWGPFVDRSLLLSSHPYTYDALEWQVHSSLFEFRHLFAAFNRSSRPSVSDNMPGRYFAVHALNFMLGRWGTLGILESMVFRREAGLPDFQYVNPFSLYTVQNINQEGNGNLMLGFQWNLHPGFEKVSLKGQLVLDDIQVDDEIETDREPNHWGVDAGVYWRDCLPLRFRHLVKAGYARVSEWMYTVPDNNMNNGEGYTYLGKSLGFPQNDGDHLWAGCAVVGKNFWAASAVAAYDRSGEKNITSRWHDSDSANIDGLPYDYLVDNFPSGTVEKAVSVRLEGLLYLKDLANARIGIDNRWIKNEHHEPTEGYAFDPRFYCEIAFHLGNCTLALPE
ncbi:MAG: hypothetical protein JW768_15635 [Chitinispirillaceae bacterium]|nr:hypothetical protein [Chitinispirillaceae bacterium]